MTIAGTPGGSGTAVDSRDRRLFRTGGIAALVLVAGYLATFPLYAVVGGPPPSGAEARLAHYAGHLSGWWTILCLMVLTDVLYLVTWLALHEALKSTARNLSLISLVFAALFVILDLAVTWPNHGAMFVLSKSYAAAAGAAERAPLIAAAGFPSAVLDSPVPGIYAWLIPSLGPFLASLAMWKSGFGRMVAVVGTLIGLSGALALLGPLGWKQFEHLLVPNALLVTFWFGFVGVRLFRLGRG